MSNVQMHWKRPGGREVSVAQIAATRISDRRHLVPKHQFGAKHLVFCNLSGQPKAGLSALDPKRQLGVSYTTAWLIQQKLMQAMVERDAQYTLYGNIQADDAYLGGELTGGKAGHAFNLAKYGIRYLGCFCLPFQLALPS